MAGTTPTERAMAATCRASRRRFRTALGSVEPEGAVVGTIVVRRPPRRPAPELPSGEVVLEAPPEIPRSGGRQWGQMLMSVPMMAGSGAMGLMSGGGASKADMAYARRQYMRGLSQHRVRVTRAADEQRTAMAYLHPAPDELWSVASSYRLWERRRDDVDFGVARIGYGSQTLATPLVPPATRPLESLEPLSAVALRRFITSYTSVPGLPAAMAVNGFSRVYVQGEPERARGLTRAVLAQLATFHAPDDLLIAVCTDSQLYDQ